MSEYYVGAIRVDSNYLYHGRTKGVKNGQGKFFQNGVPTALGVQKYGEKSGYNVIGLMRRPGDTRQLGDWRNTNSYLARKYNNQQRKGISVTRDTRTGELTVGSRSSNSPREYNTQARIRSAVSQSPNKNSIKIGSASVSDSYNSNKYREGLITDEDRMDTRSNGTKAGYYPTENYVGKTVNAAIDKYELGSLRTGVQNIGMAVSNWGQQAVKDVGSWLSGAANTVKSWLSSAGTWAKNTYRTVMGKFRTSEFYSAASKVVGKIKDWGRTAIGSIKSIAGKIGSFMGNIFSKVGRAVNNTVTNIRGKRDYSNGTSANRDSKTGEIVLTKDSSKRPVSPNSYKYSAKAKDAKSRGGIVDKKKKTDYQR